MADYQAFLRKLTDNLNLLREREAKYGGNAPLELLNQIADHAEAIALTEQAHNGQLTESAWREALEPLLIAIQARPGDETASSVTLGDIGGSIQHSTIAGRDVNQITVNVVSVLAEAETDPALRSLSELVLKQVAAIDPRTVHLYPQNSAKYADRLQEALAELVEADRGLAARLEALLTRYEQSPHSRASLKGSGAIAQDNSQAASGGGVVVGGNVGGDVITNINMVAETFWQQFRPQRLSREELQQATERYLTYLLDRYRFLDFKGMGVSDRVPLRLPLVEMYVPLKARIELPDGETWSRKLRLVGRAVSEEEAEAMGQRLSEPQPVLELLQQQPGLIILGDPGAGKTTFLKFLALQLATGQGETLGLGHRLPILLPLSAYANALADKDIPLDRFIPTYYRERGVDLPLGPMLDEALAQGGALLLLDGLDEVKEQGQRGLVVERVLDFFGVQQQRGNKFILTSRIVGYREVRPTHPGLAEGTLVDFEEEEIAQFIAKWTGALERAAQGDTAVAAQEAAREAAELLAAVERNPGVRRLAANPLLLTILALMKRQGVTLPERRVELYQKYVETLLKTWNLARGLGRPTTRDLDVVETLKVLAPLTLWMHRTSPGVGLVKREAMRRELERIYRERATPEPEQAARQFLADVREHASLLLERGAGEFGFIHLTFQEYLAAVALAQQGQSDIGPVAEALAAHLADETWREVSLLTVGYIGIIQQRDQAAGELAWQLTQHSAAGAILAGEAICDAGPGGVTAQSRAKVVQVLSRVILAERQVEPKTRAIAGTVLGRLGDPREGVTTLPPLLTPVLEGEFLYGENKEPRTVAPFQAGVYPVTNAQFAQFIKAKGYDRPAWWSKEGWQWRQKEDRSQPRWWSDSEVNNPNQPVVGVSWYEAEAFCRWLSETYGQPYRLPTEVEWERLARGQDGREYPWGNEWREGLANTRESDIGLPSTVGLFPGGVSPAGAYDCAGNVWEWCVDWYDKEQMVRVLRGGSWVNDQSDARCAVRNRFIPDNGVSTMLGCGWSPPSSWNPEF